MKQKTILEYTFAGSVQKIEYPSKSAADRAIREWRKAKREQERIAAVSAA